MSSKENRYANIAGLLKYSHSKGHCEFMGTYQYLAYLFTLIFGGIFTYFLLNPLGLLVYLLLWVDSFVLPRLFISGVLGFELISLSAIISGIALGPWYGFLFVLFGIPLIVSSIKSIVNWNVIPVLPNFDVLIIALVAVVAGALKSQIPFVPLIFISILFKHFIINMVNAKMGNEITYMPSALNIGFTVAFTLAIERIGLLDLFL